MIATCGECLVDLLPDGPGRYRARPGGSPANTAVTLARLGTPSLLLARLSRDELGQVLRRHLVANEVDLSCCVDTDDPTGVAVVSRDSAGGASYRFALDGAADWQWTADELPALPGEVTAVHAGSLALALPPGGPVLETLLARERGRRTISIDPNLRPSLLGDPAQARARMDRWLALADVVKASTEDVELLFPGRDPVDVARSWAASGPALVVITAGADGLVAVVAGEVLRLPAVEVTVVDTVGAGDTFSGALLHALSVRGLLGGRLPGLSVDLAYDVLRYAAAAAAITCSREGADPPRASELQP